MKVSDIIWTPKMRAVLRDEAQVLFLGGATSCSKSLVAGHIFMDWLNELPTDRTQFYIIFKDRGTGVRNFLQNKDSFYNMFPHLRNKYSASKEGGLQFVFHGLYGDKIIYLLGADDRDSWSKVLGSNPDGIWLEELSALHEDAVRECMGRAISRRCRLIGTTNGGLPDQIFYTEFLNHAVVQFKDTVPAIELEEMLEDKPHYHYYHFNIMDDSPHLSWQDKQNLLELYPPGTFYHSSKILGVRGFSEGAIYAPYMTDDLLIDYDRIDVDAIEEIICSVDIGTAKGEGDNKHAKTICTLAGFTRGCQRAVVLEAWFIPSNDIDTIVKEVDKRILPYWINYYFKLSKIVIDYGDSGDMLIRSWRLKTRYKNITVKGAVKTGTVQGKAKAINLQSRAQLKCQLLMQKRLLWSSRAIKSYNAHKRLLATEDGAELEQSDDNNDYGDSLTYTLTEKWVQISKMTEE